MGSLASLLPYVRPYRRTLAWGAVCIALGAAFGSLAPLAVKQAVDAMREGAAWGRIAAWSGAVLGLALVHATFRYGQRRLVYDASREMEADLRDSLYARLVRQPPAFFDHFPTGDVLSRFTNDLGAVRMAAGPGFLFGINTLATLALSVSLMLWIDVRLTLWALLPLPFVTMAVKWIGQRIHHRSEAAQAALADVSNAVQENLAGLRVVRAYGREVVERATFGERSERYVEANLRLARIQATLSPLLGFLLGGSLLILLYVGGRRVAGGSLTLGDFVAFTMYLGMIAWPLIAFGWIANLFQRAAASMGRLNAILLAEPAIDDRHARPGRRPAGGAVRLEDVVFRYGPGRPAVLDGLSLDVPEGATVAITGPTGSGKSTLVSLLPRLHDPESGAVLVDGRPVSSYPLAALRGAIGMAPQEPFLFSATLRANLEVGLEAGAGRDGGPPRLGIEEAAEIAGLAGDVAGFPEGWETRVGERGITLSGGQKQRVALARALLADPLLLVLDDAFSSVDTETEERILARLRAFMAARTTILVGHRISTLRNADRITVLAGGRILEEGSHEELIAGGGWYADLDRRQRLEEQIERA